MMGSEWEAVVVDPQRDVDLYLKAAEEHGLTIRHIFETHLHADFVSGHKELAARTGANIYLGAQRRRSFPHVPVRDGFELTVRHGVASAFSKRQDTLPKVICLVVTDEEKAAEAVGGADRRHAVYWRCRPSRSLEDRTRRSNWQACCMTVCTRNLCRCRMRSGVSGSRRGSLCGRNMRAERSSTIGTERLTNYALQIKSRDEFVKQLTTNLPARPDYFLEDAEINRRRCARALGDEGTETHCPGRAEGVIGRRRHGARYSAGRSVRRGPRARIDQHRVVRTICDVGWNNTWLVLTSVLIADSQEQLAEARLRLARVGIETERGFLQGGVSAWKHAGFSVAQLQEVTPQDLQQQLSKAKIQVLDVRREPEWMAGHVAGATWWPLDRFRVSPPEVDPNLRLAVHCQSGYRSMIACSLLERAGYNNVVNVSGGFAAWQEARLPVETGAPVEG